MRASSIAGPVFAALAIAAATGGCGVEPDGAATTSTSQDVMGPRPDYVISAISEPPAAALNGAAFSITTTVDNIGTADATTASKTKFFLSVDPVFGGDVGFDQMVTVPPIAMGASDTQTIVLHVAAGVASGTYYLIACADKTGAVPELDNTNNCASSTGTVTITGPDLIVESLSDPPADLAPGGTFSITDAVRNIGTAPSRTTRVGYFLSPLPKRAPGQYKIAVRRFVDALDVGGTNTGTVVATVPATAAPGSYYLVACVDIGSLVVESNEKNDCIASATTTAVGPDLTVSALSVSPATILAGDTVSIVDTATNTGHSVAAPSTTRFFLSTDPVPGGDLALATRVIQGLGAGGTDTGTTAVTIEVATTPGDYFVIACADADNVVAELSETNNCRASTTVTVLPPDLGCGGSGGMVVDTVATTDGFTELRQGAVVDLVITGSGLDPVTLVQVGDLTAAVTSVSATEVHATIDLPHGAPPGARTLTVSAAPAPDCAEWDGLAVTPFVVAPGGTPDGLGTYQSPLNLCADALEEQVGEGDAVHLTAGTHACGDTVELWGLVSLTGEGVDTTTITGVPGTGFAGFYLSSPAPVEMSGMTLNAPGETLVVSYGDYHVSNVKIVGGRGFDVYADGHTAVTLDGVDYVGAGSGAGEWGVSVRGNGAQITATNSRFTDVSTAVRAGEWASVTLTDTDIVRCGTGVELQAATAVVTGVTIDSCDTGLRLIALSPWLETTVATVTASTLVDNTVGGLVANGALHVDDTMVYDDDATARASNDGFVVTDGVLDLDGVTITGMDRAGIEYSSNSELAPVSELADTLIDGGPRGIYAAGGADCASLRMTTTTIQNQTLAAISWGIDDTCEVDLRGGNHLSVLSGYALEDVRPYPFPGANIKAAGLTLNGNTYTGFVSGPTDHPPDYRVTSSAVGIEF